MSTILSTVIGGNYRIDEKIGEGGMGTIYKGHHLTLDRTIAVKVLHPHLITNEDITKRFHREARAASRLRHEHIISIIDFGKTEDGMHYMVMEFVTGKPLDQIIYEMGVMNQLIVIRLAMQICLALDEAHANGIVHRDMKPENVMIERRRTHPMFVKVVDFGIAKILDPETGNAKGTKLTRDGFVCGTPEYVSPEQAQAKELDGRSDLYSLGVVMFQMLTGDIPFNGNAPIDIAIKHLMEKPKPPSEKGITIDNELDQLILKLMAKEPDDRPETARDVYDSLERILGRISSTKKVERAQTAMSAKPVTSTAIVEAIPVYDTPADSGNEVTNDSPTQITKGTPIPQQSSATSISMDSLASITKSRRPLMIASIAAVLLIGITLALYPRGEPDDQQVHTASAAEIYTKQEDVDPVAIAPKTPDIIEYDAGATMDTSVAAPPVTPKIIAKAMPRILRNTEKEFRRVRRTPSDAPPVSVTVAPPDAKEPRKRVPYKTLITQATQAKAASKWKRAIRLFKEALKQRRSARLYKEIARAYLKSGNKASACRYFRKYINAHPAGEKRETATQRIAHFLNQCG